MTQATLHLRLGSRGSLLAVAQSRQIAQALESSIPNLRVSLLRIDTQGDRDLKTPLSQVNAPDFFSDTLDAALLRGDVDFTVHSRKDIASQRPAGIFCAALPRREDPRDVIVFRAGVIERLRNGDEIRIGSSSARRQIHVQRFLQHHLPQVGPEPRLVFRPLRGAVDQRLTAIHADASSPEALDGVVLALAGLTRLWQDSDGQAALRTLLSDVRWLVLPLSACPTAPGQGALALECRADDDQTIALLARLHDAGTAARVAREYEALEALPPQQQDGFGATAIEAAAVGPLLFSRSADDLVHSQLAWTRPPRPAMTRPWYAKDKEIVVEPLAVSADALQTQAMFIAHWRAATGQRPALAGKRLWVSGLSSWRHLAELGLWVEGCADHLGFAAVVPTLAAPVLQLPPLSDWCVLTRDGAQASWADSGVGQVTASYRVCNFAAVQEPALATDFYWSSREQFVSLRSQLPADARHACGNGKTAAALRALGIEPLVFPNRREWLSWVA